MTILSAKVLAIVFGLATIGLIVSTVVLAVQKAELQDELDDALDKLENIDGTTSTVTTVSTTTTPGNPGDTTTTTTTTPGNPGDTTTTTTTTTPDPNSTEFPWPTLTDAPPTTPNPNFPVPSEIIYRLPTHARPWRYQLYLHPDLATGTYEGTVSIGISIDKLTNVLALHSKDLEIFGVSLLMVMVKMRIKIKSYYTDPARELLIIEFDEVLQTDYPYTLSITFRGKLNGLSGLYSSSYTDSVGEQK